MVAHEREIHLHTRHPDEEQGAELRDRLEHMHLRGVRGEDPLLYAGRERAEQRGTGDDTRQQLTGHRRGPGACGGAAEHVRQPEQHG